MDISQALVTIYETLLHFVPLFRVVWAVTVILGIAMLLIAFVLKENPVKKRSPWIVGGIGLLMVISSGTQLFMSYF